MKAILTLLISISTTMLFAQSDEVMTNYSVMTMLKKGLSKQIIITKIKKSPNKFDISTEALVFLKENNVPDDVITLMVEQAGETMPTEPAPIKSKPQTYSSSSGSSSGKPQNSSSNSPLLPQYAKEVADVLPNLFESGIFYYNVREGKYTKLDATVVTGNKSGGFGQGIASSLTMGLSNTKTTSSLDGAKANLQVKNTNMIFYFYFDYKKSSINNSINTEDQLPTDNYFAMLGRWTAQSMNNGQNAVAISPNDFKLIELDKNKYKRWMVTNKQNAYSTVSGVDSKSVYNLKYERLTPSLFKVVLKENARPGEYCFFYAGNSAKQSSGETFYSVNQLRVFDFGILDAEK